MKRWLIRTLVVLGLLIVAGGLVTGWVFQIRANRPRPRAGWTIVRPPSDAFAMAYANGVLYSGGKEGIVRIDPATGAALGPLPGGESLTFVRALAFDQQGTLWIGHEHGLARYDGHTLTHLPAVGPIAPCRVNALFVDGRGRVWVGTDDGLACHDHGTWQSWTIANGLQHNMVNAILVEDTGAVWVGNYAAPIGGLSCLHEGRWHHFSTRNGLPHNNVTSLCRDRDGGIWVGTGLIDRGGAVQLVWKDGTPVIARALTKSDGLVGEKVRSIFQDRSSALWFGSEYHGVARLSGGRFRPFTVHDGLADPEIMAMAQLPDGALWLATRGGLTRISAQALEALATDDTIAPAPK